MDKRTTDIVAYLTPIGLIIALLFGDRERSKFHVNQALVIWLASIFDFVPFFGFFWGIFCIICTLKGLISATNGVERKVPLLGDFKILR